MYDPLPIGLYIICNSAYGLQIFWLVTLTPGLAYFPWLPGVQIWCGDRAIGK